MFAFKKKYFLIIESIKNLELKNIKKNKKLIIIYRRNNKKTENIEELKKFRQVCYIKDFKFFVANNIQLAVLLKADGLYISSHNKSFKCLFLKNLNYTIIGSAHNPREISLKFDDELLVLVFGSTHGGVQKIKRSVRVVVAVFFHGHFFEKVQLFTVHRVVPYWSIR